MSGRQVWLLIDDRAGNRAQCEGVAAALGVAGQVKGLVYGWFGKLPNGILGASFAGLTAASRAALTPPWPDLVIAAGRRSGPVARRIKRLAGGRTRLVQIMDPGPSGADEFDLIHNNFDFVPLTFSRFINTPILTTIHGFSSPEILKVYRKYKELYYVSISDSDRDSQLPYLATVYNGIDLTNLTFRKNPGSKLVWLGRIHPDKGVHLAIEVAKKSSMDLVIAGIIQDRDYFDNLVKPAINGSSIEYIGPVDPPKRDALFEDAFALLHLNTIPERFGLVLAEAMAAGIPVIAADLGSCREVIADDKTGFLVNSVDQAVEALANIDKIDRTECRKRVEENFTIDCMVTGYEKVYAEIFRREEKLNKTNSQER